MLPFLFKLVYILAYQIPSFLLRVYLYAKLLHMPTTDSILSINLYVYNLVQSFILAWYMPALYADNSISYLRLSIYYCKQVALSSYMSLHVSTCISATVL
jgi:hypothetical protein